MKMIVENPNLFLLGFMSALLKLCYEPIVTDSVRRYFTPFLCIS